MNNDDETRTSHSSDQSDITCRTNSEARSLTCGICSFESFEYYPDERAYRALFDADESSPSEAVVGVISTAADIDPVDVEQLGSKTDADALNSLITNRRPFEGDVYVTFTLNGYDVSLSSYGSIVVRPPPSDESSVNAE